MNEMSQEQEQIVAEFIAQLTAHMRANLTVCQCHNSLTDAQLMAYEYDTTYKDANYAGDLHKLYPRLYGVR
jgi:hypothetical protein